MNEDLTPFDNTPSIDLLADLREIIHRGKAQAVAAVNSTLTLTYWHVGKRINDEILRGERAAYGEQAIALVAQRLTEQFGKGFEAKNLRRMMNFAEIFPDSTIVAPLVRQLSWSHFLCLLPLKTHEARLFYAQQTSQAHWSKRELARQIERKAYERAEIADGKLELAATSELAGSFKDPYFFDFLGLPDGYLENDLRKRQHHGRGVLDGAARQRAFGTKAPQRHDRNQSPPLRAEKDRKPMSTSPHFRISVFQNFSFYPFFLPSFPQI